MRRIIRIDESKCDGCGICAEACHEGAIVIEQGKAKLVSDSYCDGLGDCIGECPQGAISFETRDAASYDESAVRERVTALQKQAAESDGRLPCGCSGATIRELKTSTVKPCDRTNKEQSAQEPELRNWPVQIGLVPAGAPWLAGADLLIAADCTAFSCPNFHRDLLRGKVCLVGCPKLDDADAYADKIAQIISLNKTPRIDVAYMEVPCCGGLAKLVERTISQSGEAIILNLTKLALDGKIVETRTIFPR